MSSFYFFTADLHTTEKHFACVAAVIFSALQMSASRQGLPAPRHPLSPHGCLRATQGLVLQPARHGEGCTHASEPPHGSGRGGRGCSGGFLPHISRKGDVLLRNHVGVCVVTARLQQSHHAGVGKEKCKPRARNLPPL